MSTPPYPARLHVLLARNSPKAVVIRRGPARQVCTIGWDRSDDTWTMGQWLKGRIYEYNSDLSPDGQHLVYGALKGYRNGEWEGFYTVVSRAPYLRALAWWTTLCGAEGGFFDGARSLRSLGQPERRTGRPGGVTVRWMPTLALPPGFPELPVYWARLQRDGWRHVYGRRIGQVGLIERLAYRVRAGNAAADGCTVLAAAHEKPVAGEWFLRKVVRRNRGRRPGFGPVCEHHELLHVPTGRLLDQPGWEWADVDGGRLLWAEAGCLYAGALHDSGLTGVRLLRDFNGMTFEPLVAPY